MDSSISSKMENSISSSTANSITSSNSTTTHNKLYDNWSLWGHLPHDIDWTLKSYKQITTLETVEQTITLYETLPESLSDEKNIRANITGITISPKKNFCIVKIWLSTCDFQNSKAIIEIPGGITSQGCLFKKHMQ